MSTGLAAGVCVLAAAGGFAVAGEYAGVTVEVDGWTIIPVHDTVATTHLIALRNDDALRATDIDAVLYTRTASGWDAKAYAPGVSKADALVDLAADLGLGDPMALDWELGVDPSGLTGGDFTRAPFGKGFFLSDPLYPAAAAMADPEPLAELVEALGGASASSAVHTGSVTPIDEPDIGGTGEGGCVYAPHDQIADSLDQWLSGMFAAYEDAIRSVAAEYQSRWNCCFPGVYEFSRYSTPWTCGEFTHHSVSANPPVLGICVHTFYRIATRTQYQTRVEVRLNCSTTSCQQSRSCSSYQYVTCSVNAVPTLPPGGTCEGTWCDPADIACGPDSTGAPDSIYCNDWLPKPCP